MVPNYGVLKGRPQRWERGLHATKWHFQVLVCPNGTFLRMAVNVLSTECLEDLECLVINNFSYAGTGGLASLSEGFTPLPLTAAGTPHPLALDNVRGNMFDKSGFRVIAPVTIGTANDLNDILDDIIAKSYDPDPAASTPPAAPIVYAFGSGWVPKTPPEADQYFNFLPSRGVHNIHMNQGNPLQLSKPCQQHHDADNGVWHDGGLIVDPGNGQHVGVFLKFATQSWQTDDTTGHPV